MTTKRTTFTTLVLEYLREVDDLVSYQQIHAHVPGCDYHNITAAVHQLKKYKCIDFVVDVHGRPLFFALPPEDDTRTIVHEERALETQPRKRRRLWSIVGGKS